MIDVTFVPLAKRQELKEGVCKRFRGNGLDLLLVQSQAELYIVDNLCPHDRASLAKGEVANGCIRCPKHRIVFDLVSGQAQGGEVTAGIPLLKRYSPVWLSDEVGIQLP